MRRLFTLSLLLLSMPMAMATVSAEGYLTRLAGA